MKFALLLVIATSVALTASAHASSEPSEASRTFQTFTPKAMASVYSRTWVQCAFDQAERLVHVRQTVRASVDHALGHCVRRASQYQEALIEYYSSLDFIDPAKSAARQVEEARASLANDLHTYLIERRRDEAFHR